MYRVFQLFVIQIIIFEVLSSVIQAPVKQYIRISNVAPQTQPNIQSSIQSSLANLPITYSLPQQKCPPQPLTIPVSGVPTFSSLSIPNLISKLPSQPSNLPSLPPVLSGLLEPCSTSSLKDYSSSSDSNVLNNLAIALQLLIISNLLKTPLPESVSTELAAEGVLPGYKPAYQTLTQFPEPMYPRPCEVIQPMLNSNFVGTSNFADSTSFGILPPSVYGIPSSSKSSLSLMSPYEALGTKSYPDAGSPYGPGVTALKEFPSPYAAILSDGPELFSF